MTRLRCELASMAGGDGNYLEYEFADAHRSKPKRHKRQGELVRVHFTSRRSAGKVYHVALWSGARHKNAPRNQRGVLGLVHSLAEIVSVALSSPCKVRVKPSSASA